MFKQAVDPKRFESFIGIADLINSNYPDMRALLAQILECAAGLAGAQAAWLLFREKEAGEFSFEIALGFGGKAPRWFSLEEGEEIAGRAAERRAAFILEEGNTYPRFFAGLSSQAGFPAVSLLAAPLSCDNEVLAVIGLVNKKDGGRFTQEDLDWMEVFAGQAARAIRNMKNLQKAHEEIGILRDKVVAGHGYHIFVGSGGAIQEKLSLAKKVAASDSSVLILGESGVGKELFAEQIHLNSPRKDGPFIRVNCAALPEALLESELFGHVKGAFTDASSLRRGRFELANGGTIFLDEVGDIPLPLQAKLLRVLQHRVFERLGSNDLLTADARIVAATNKDIEKEVEKGSFRSDLYYRLNVLPMHIPPLRQRPEDIMELAEFFLARFAEETGKKIKGFSETAVKEMFAYSWPGNVRELENAVQRAAVVTMNDLIGPGDLLLPLDRGKTGDSYAGKPFREAVQGFKKSFLSTALKNNNWNQTVTAQSLKIQRTYLAKLVKELEISK
ncbi:MAG: sigma 54-interacting transcriptional regulator [Spirochaetaceae bacterium]|nr:sigma 54-interacting transcriptional regulator [Spirochaetaceae bacterium]